MASKYFETQLLNLVNDACPELMKKLEQRGFTVVPVQHRHRCAEDYLH